MMFAMSVSLLNPHAILWIRLALLVRARSAMKVWTSPYLHISTILVSWIWFLSLAFAGKKVGDADTRGKILYMINKISALVIWAVAVYIAMKLFNLV
ncbi:LysE family transporter [Paenibacillus dokdonensis]|uniref:LysE family transporter n=1 Tax=Paenibacillus dokdonensis TaxID=2567944 RepID=A0ABU6GGP0_9BACL|nr:LysE family transporter [Paenibacillus dokdonensis]MEC0238884.1 LysE family transporter [Paenibacillus dokdonensis]